MIAIQKFAASCCVAGLLATISSIAGCSSSGPVAAPTSYSQYNSKDGTFACDSPDDWEVTGGGGHGPTWAKFVSGPAEIRFNADISGSLMGDIARNASGGDPLPPSEEPVQKIHEQSKEEAEKEFSGYQEVGGIKVLTVSLGPARQSEFTASTTFGSGLHGYRVTVIGHDKRVIAYCVAPESDWTTLKPAFDRVLASLTRGSAN